MSKFQPLNDKVLIENSKALTQETTASGIILQHNNPERHYFGKVLAVGTSPDISVAPGDTVYYEKGVQYTIEKDNKIYDFVSCYDIICKEVE